MRRSEDRILTTHTGSLPRPPELTRLYVRQARGESVDRLGIPRRRRCRSLINWCENTKNSQTRPTTSHVVHTMKAPEPLSSSCVSFSHCSLRGWFDFRGA